MILQHNRLVVNRFLK